MVRRKYRHFYLKNAAIISVNFFFILFNAIPKYEEIPKKYENQLCVHKPYKPKDEIKSYRPVSVSKNFMKLFEALILNNVNSFIT